MAEVKYKYIIGYDGLVGLKAGRFNMNTKELETFALPVKSIFVEDLPELIDKELAE